MDRRLVPPVLVAAGVLVLGGIALAIPAGAETLVFTTTVSGANEVPPSGSSATGSATFTVDTETNQVCVDATVTGLSGPVEADHIHQGAAGVNGPVVVDFMASLDTCVTASADVVAAMVATPSAFYFNIHTDEFSSGEVRGQLSLQVLPPGTTVGPPGTVSSTVPPPPATIPPPAVRPAVVNPTFTG